MNSNFILKFSIYTSFNNAHKPTTYCPFNLILHHLFLLRDKINIHVLMLIEPSNSFHTHFFSQLQLHFLSLEHQNRGTARPFHLYCYIKEIF